MTFEAFVFEMLKLEGVEEGLGTDRRDFCGCELDRTRNRT